MKAIKLLVVDDDTVIALQLTEWLQTMGYEVVGRAFSGEASITMAKSLNPDVVLMDIVMPGVMDGIEASERIKAELDIPVLFLTAYTDDEFIERAKIVEPFGYVVKPFREREIKAAIELAFYRKHLERQLRQAEEKRRETEERYQALFERSMDSVFLNDFEGRFIDANPAAMNLLGYSKEEIPSLSFASVMSHEDQLPKMLAMIRELQRNDSPMNLAEFRLKRKDGSCVWVETQGSVVYKAGKPYAVQGIARNITERKQVEEVLRYSREKLRALAAHLQSVREEERSRIAREIHDVLAQDLIRIKIDLLWISQRMGKPVDGVQQKAILEKLSTMVELMDNSILSVQRIATELRPVVLDSLGLFAAIEWQAEDFEARTGIRCETLLPTEYIPLDRDHSTALFRILQESLTNVVRHAQATRVKIRLIQDRDYLVLFVQDNGRGMTLSQIDDPRSLGLLGIRERAQMFHGRAEITSSPGQGTTVEARIPLPRPSKRI